MAHRKKPKRTGDTAEEAETGSALIDTAEFKALVELGDELFDDNERPDEDDATDPLAITDKFKTVPDDDENPGFDPYNNT